MCCALPQAYLNERIFCVACAQRRNVARDGVYATICTVKPRALPYIYGSKLAQRPRVHAREGRHANGPAIGEDERAAA